MLFIVRLLRRRIWLIAAITAARDAAGAARHPRDAAGVLLGVADADPEARWRRRSPPRTDSRLMKLNLTTEVERLMSRDTAIRVIEELDLASLPEFNPTPAGAPAAREIKGAIRRAICRRAKATSAPRRPTSIDAITARVSSAGSTWRKEANSDVMRIGFQLARRRTSRRRCRTRCCTSISTSGRRISPTRWRRRTAGSTSASPSSRTASPPRCARVEDYVAKLGPERQGSVGRRSSNRCAPWPSSAPRSPGAAPRWRRRSQSIAAAATVADKVMLTDSPALAALEPRPAGPAVRPRPAAAGLWQQPASR